MSRSIKRAHTDLRKHAHNNWSATTDMSCEGIRLLVHTRTSAGCLITSLTDLTLDNPPEINVTGTPKLDKVNQMTVGTHHKRVLQRLREDAKAKGLRI